MCRAQIFSSVMSSWVGLAPAWLRSSSFIVVYSVLVVKLLSIRGRGWLTPQPQLLFVLWGCASGGGK